MKHQSTNPPPHHATTPTRQQANTPQLHHSPTQPRHPSTTPKLHHSTTQQPNHSTTQPLNNSTTQQLNNSTTQQLHHSTSCRPSRPRRAFSLIEVVFAVAIFGMAATVLISAFTNALLARERGVSNDQLNADIRAVRMQLLLEPNIEDAEDGDTYETLNNGLATWETRIEPTNIVDLFRVELRIDFTEPPESLPRNYEESLFLLRPTWSESDERSNLLQDKREELENMRRRMNF